MAKNINTMTKAELSAELLKLKRKIKKLEKLSDGRTKQREKKSTGADEAFNESGLNYRALIESSLDAIYVLQDDKLVSVNPAWERLFGYESKEALKNDFDYLQVIAPQSRFIYEEKKLASKLNIPFDPRFDLQGITRDGTLIELEAIVTEIHWNGKPALQGIYRDITERKNIEEALRREAFIFDNLKDAVIIIDLSGSIMNWNPAASKMFGYTRDEVINRKISFLTKNNGGFAEGMFASIEKEGKWSGELTFNKKDGSEGISETVIFPFLDAHGERVALVGVNRDITKRKESEEELRESEEKFRKIAEHSLVGMYIIQDGKFRYVNPRFAEIIGYKTEELIDKLGPVETAAPGSHNIVSKNISKRLSGMLESIQYEFQIIRKDKSVIDVEAYGSRIMYQGRIAIAGTLLDITERKQYEQSLKESQKKYRELADFLPQTVFEIDLDGNFQFVNRSSFTAFRYDQEDFEKGLNVFQMLIPGDRSRGADYIRKTLQGQKGAEQEYVMLRKDGTTFPALVFSTVVYKDNKPSGLRGILIDITERKQIEGELRKLSRAVEQSPNSIMITNIFGDLEYVNPMFTQLTGYSFNEVVGKNPRFLKSGETNDSEYKKLWGTLLNNETWRGELHNKKKNGELYWESVSISPIIDSNGKITHFLAIKEDITEKKMIEKELIKAKEKAEESDRLKSEFLAQMSHEIRSPINIILSYNSFIRDEFAGKLDNYIESSFNSIDTAGRRLLRTLDLILNMAAVQNGYVDLQLSPVDLQRIINELVKEFEFSARSKNLNLIFTPVTKRTMILADDYIVGEIFQNLIGNAIKYTHEGRIEIKVYELDNKICAEVTDTGIGISEDYMPKLFLPFTQEETGYSRKYEGNGLGLALVKKYTELIDAEIKVCSKKGNGSQFSLIFNKPVD